MMNCLRRCVFRLCLMTATWTAFGVTPPYVEHFEADLGNWAQGTNDYFDWIRHSGYTPSGYPTNQTTGPSTAYGGTGSYVYLETSYPRSEGDEAHILLDIDCRTVHAPRLDFRYHRCGASMGPFYVETSTGTAWTVAAVWTGAQQLAETDPWARASISLTNIAGKYPVRLRLRGVRGSSYTGDHALDAVAFYESRSIARQGFEGDVGDTWSWMPVPPGQVDTNSDRVLSGSWALRLTGSDGGGTNAYVEFSTIDISAYTNVALILPFAALGPDPGDDLHVVISTNNGASWSGFGYGEQVADGGGPLDLPFNTLSGGRTPRYANPYILDIPDSVTQLAVRVQFFDANPSDNRNDHYYLDDIQLAGAYRRHPFSLATDNGLPGWYESGDCIWEATTSEVHSGETSLMTSPGDSESVLLQTVVKSPGTLSFWWKTTLLSGDSFLCNIGGTDILLANGPTNEWQYTELVVEDGKDLIQWVVQRTSLPGSGDESVWLDHIHFAPAVTNLPYVESFENGWGVWSQSDNDDFDWHSITGSTPSVGTGPSQAHDGDWYIYTEMSGLTNGAQSSLKLELDLSSYSNAWMTFAYHMFGQYGGDDMVGDLYVEADNGVVQTSLWHRGGSIQATNESPWSRGVVDLSAFHGSVATVQLRGVRSNGIAGWAGDMAVDQISICESVPLPLAEPLLEATWPAGWMSVTENDPDLDASMKLVQTGSHPSVVSLDGGAFVEFNSYYCDDDDRMRLTLPPVNTLGITQGVDVAFMWHEDPSYSSSTNEGVCVIWSTNGVDWTEAGFFPRIGSVPGWFKRMGRLPEGANNRESLFVGFEFISDYGNNCHLDDVSVMASTNTPPSNISLTPQQIAENSLPGTQVGTLSADDVQGGEMVYDLVAGTGAFDNSLFSITGDALYFNQSGDHENRQYYSIRVRVSDHGALTFEKVLMIEILDVDEAPVGAGDTYAVSLGGDCIVSAPGVLSNDADPEGAELSAVLLDGPQYGAATLGADGTLAYTNDGTSHAVDTLTYAPVSGSLTGSAVTVTFDLVSPVHSVTASKGTYSSYIRVAWDSVSGAAGYAVYRSTEGDVDTAVGLLSTTSLYYYDYSVDQGVTYYYWIRPVAGGSEGPFGNRAYGYRDSSSTVSCSVDDDGCVKHAGDSFTTEGDPYVGWIDKYWPWENDEEFRSWVFWNTGAIPSGRAVEEAEINYLGYEKVDYQDSEWFHPRAARITRSRSSFFGASAQTRFEYSDALNVYSASYFYMDVGSDQGGAHYIYDIGIRRDDIMELLDGGGFGLAFVGDNTLGSAGTDSTKCRAKAGSIAVQTHAAPGPRLPVNNSRMTSMEYPHLVWNTTLDSGNYYLETRVQVSDNASFSSIVYDNTINAYGSSGTNGCTLSPLSGTPTGEDYYWRVRCEDFQNDGNHSDWSSSFRFDIFTVPGAATEVDASDGLLSEGILVAWTAPSGADGYRIYRDKDTNPVGAELLGNTSNTFWLDASAEEATNYYYWVTATNIAGAGSMSAYDSGYWGFAAPVHVAASDGSVTGGVQITWSTVVDALEYEVWRGLASTTNSMSLFRTTYSTFLLDDTTDYATNYHYRVRARRDLAVSRFSDSDMGCKGLSVPGQLQVTRGTYTDRVVVTWNPVEGAHAYDIVRNTSSNFVGASTVATISGLVWTNNSVTPGAAYYYAIQAANPVTTGSPSDLVCGYTGLSAPTNVAATDGDYNYKVKITWDGVPDAVQYRIYRSLTNDIESATVMADTAGIYFNDYSVSPGITYYYWVSARGTGAESEKAGSDSGYRLNAGELSCPIADRGSIRCRGGDSFHTESSPYIGWREDFWSDDDEWRAYIWWDSSVIPAGNAIEHATIDYLGYSKVDYPDNDWTRPRGARMTSTYNQFFSASGEHKFRDEDKLNVLRGSLGKVVDFTSDRGDYHFVYDIEIDRADYAALLSGNDYGIGFASDDTRNNMLGSDSSKCYIYAGNITVESYGAPGLNEPADMATVPAGQVMLRWNAVLDSSNWYLEYQVQVDDSPSFSSPLVDRNVQAFGVPVDTSTRLSFSTGSGSQGGRPLYWRVRCKDYLLPENCSDWSATRTMLVLNPPQNAPPWILASDDVYGDRVDVSWGSVTNAGGYLLYRGTNTDWSSAIPLTATTNLFYIDTTDVRQRTNYYWVAATNIGGTGPWQGPEDGSRSNRVPVINTNPTVNVVMSEDSYPTAFALELHASDADGDTLVWSLASAPSHGGAIASDTGTVLHVSYTSTLHFAGTDSFVVQVEDTYGGFDDVTVAVTVQPVNDGPQALPDVASTFEDQAVSVNVLANDLDPDSTDSLSIVSYTHAGGGLVSDGTNTAELIFTPFPNWFGSNSFTYVMQDTAGIKSTGLVDVVVSPVNDAPALTPYGPARPSMAWDEFDDPGISVSGLLWVSVSDVDPGSLTGLAVIGTSGTNGAWQVSTNGGTSWSFVYPVAVTQALLLCESDCLRFYPDGVSTGLPTLTWCAWDGSSGLLHDRVDASVRGGSNAFSVATDTVEQPVTAGNVKPTVQINRPLPGSCYVEREHVPLRGVGDDVEDGVLTNLTWSSSLDGVIAYGPSNDVSNFSAGIHTLSLAARDTEGAFVETSVVFAVEADNDTNGIPDVWEQQHGPGPGNGYENMDQDGDGMTSLEEWIAGTDPTNAGSCLKVFWLPTGTEDSYAIQWDGVTDRFYSVYRATNLLRGFDLITNNLSPEEPDVLNFMHAVPVDKKRFYYRVKAHRFRE